MIEKEDLTSSSTAGGWTFDVNTQKLSWSTITKEIHGMGAHYQPEIEKIDDFYTSIDESSSFTSLLDRCTSGEGL